jgi:hypothetical protein
MLKWWFSGQLSGFPTDNIEEFNGGVVDPAVSGGAYEDVAFIFGRVNYNYKRNT